VTTQILSPPVLQESNKKLYVSCIKWGTTILAPSMIILACFYGGLSKEVAYFLGLTACAVCMWATGVMPSNLVAMMLPVSYILVGVGTPHDMLVSWTAPMGWLVLGGLLTGLVLSHTGLAKRIALWSLHKTSGSMFTLLCGLLLVGFIIAPLLPTALGKGILMSVICIGICDAAKYAPKSREASVIMLAGFLASTAPRMGLYTGGGDVTLALELMKSTGVALTWGDYFIQNYVPNIVYCVCSMLLLLPVLRPKQNINTRSYVESQYRQIGTISTIEKRAVCLFIILTALMMTDKYHGINAGWTIMLIGFISFIPGLGLVDKKQLETLKLGPVFFVVGCMAVGAGAKVTGVDKLIAAQLLPLLSGKGELFTIVSTYLSATTLKFLLTPVAAAGAFTVPLVEIARSLGMNPLGLIYTFIYGLDQFVLPYEYAVLLVYYATGYVSLSSIVKFFTARLFMTLILLVIVFYPYWKLAGAI